MAIINVPWLQLPEEKYKQLKNGTKGVIFELSPQLVGKILYGMVNEEDNLLREDDESIKELEYEENINRILCEAGVGNVPKPIGIEKLKLYNGTYPVYIMEYIRDLPHGDEIAGPHEQFLAENLVKKEVYKAADLDVFPGTDYLHPWNYFYDSKNERVRLIDFGRWTTGEVLVSPYN